MVDATLRTRCDRYAIAQTEVVVAFIVCSRPATSACVPPDLGMPPHDCKATATGLSSSEPTSQRSPLLFSP